MLTQIAAMKAQATPTGFKFESHMLLTTASPTNTAAIPNQSLGFTFSLKSRSETRGTITMAVYSISRATLIGSKLTAFEYDHCIKAMPKMP